MRWRMFALAAPVMLAACAAGDAVSKKPADPGVVSEPADLAIASVVDRIAAQYLADTPVLGMSIAIARDGHIVHEAGYGNARRDPDILSAPSVPFELASVAQPITAVLLLRLAERGLLDLDAPASRAVRDLQGPYGAATLRQLLRHSSGSLAVTIDENDPDPRYLQAPSREVLIAMLGAATEAAAPDEQWIYDPAGYTVAGLAAEAVTQKPLATLVRDETGGPLALARFARCGEPAATPAEGYIAAGGVTQRAPEIDFGWLGGAGSLCGTTADLARWWLAVRSGQVISPASLQEWMTPVVLERNGVGAEFGYGLGIRLGSYGGHTLIGHVGDGAGGTTVLAEYPDDRLLIVVASNTAGPRVPHAIEVQAAIARELLGIADAPAAAAPIGPESLTAVPGLYRSPQGQFCVQAMAEELAVATDEKQAVTLKHLGGGRFTRPGAGDSLEYFLGWPDRTEWFGYAWFGFPMDLAAKESDTCS